MTERQRDTTLQKDKEIENYDTRAKHQKKERKRERKIKLIKLLFKMTSIN